MPLRLMWQDSMLFQFEFTLAPLFEDHGIALAIAGVLVVFLALTLIAGFIALLSRLSTRLPATRPVVPALPVDDDELSEEMLVVIAAAVAETVIKPHRIVRIRGLMPTDLGWSLEGRLQEHQSHRMKRRDH
jgi:Na+-transporting methylmalonyl-CoA/oxaloacetate decarboxylase gamma subunit